MQAIFVLFVVFSASLFAFFFFLVRKAWEFVPAGRRSGTTYDTSYVTELIEVIIIKSISRIQQVKKS